MIDIEADVFDRVYNVMAAEGYTEMGSVYVPVPNAFPHITLYEISNEPDRMTMDSASTENHVIVSFEAQVYAMSKHEAREVMTLLDNEMIRMGFIRTDMQTIPNELDPSVHRMVSRYRAEVDHNKVIYRPS